MSTAYRRNRAGEGADTGVAQDLDQRLSGDLAALSDFAQELSPRWNRPRGGSGPRETAGPSIPGRINADPDTVEEGLAKLVLTLIELIRRLLEKQAIRRVEAGSLSDEEIERLGETLLKLEQKMHELKVTFGLQDEDLNLNLGPLGDLVSE